MLKKNFQIAFRNILKQKAYNLLNAIGLATGIASGLIIALHIQEELSYEKDFSQSENIYRVHERDWAKSCPPLAIEMSANLPQLAAVSRFASHGTHVVDTDNNNPGEVTGFYADSSVFQVFGFKIIDGDQKQALTGLKTAVITESMAKRYFGDQSPVGKILKFDNRQEFPVVAVMSDLPRKSHLNFDYLISMPTFYADVPPDWTNNRGWMVMYTYARLNSETEFKNLKENWPDFIRKFYNGDPEVESKVRDQILQFIPLEDIHLKSDMEQEMAPNSSILYVYIFIAVEILILIVACSNFMSLFTTQAIKRMKEVGMRKIMGAKSFQLMTQFLTEVILLTILSVLLAIVFYQVALPLYNNLSGKSLGIWQIFEKDNLLVIGGILLFVIIVSGLYPAFFIARFKAGSFLREDKLPNSMPNRVRNGLVIFQFIVSVSLIASSILVHQQMNLIKNKDLGFDKDRVVNIKLYGQLWYKAFTQTEVVKNEFLKNPDIIAVGRVGNIIGEDLSVETVLPEDKEDQQNNFPSSRVIRIDENYIDAMNIPILAGRNFSRNFNDSSSFIINESAAKLMGLSDPVGKRIKNVTMNKAGTVVGLVKDYHFNSLRDKIEPLILEYRPEWTGYLTIKMGAGKTRETLSYIQSTIEKIAPGGLFVYDFLDDHLNALYRSEDNMGKVFQFFSMLTIIIACLGLLGLSAYSVESRTKEIGIRKVLGATVSGIVAMISSKFFKLVMAAYCIAVPVTWYGMHRWLANFAYQVDIQWWVFAITGVLIFMLALIVVSFHTLTAAMKNPVRSLRYE
jgi:putative ABC transport system permease protein